MVARSFAAEFPNDNSDLHLGTIWMCVEPCGPPEPHFPEAGASEDDETEEPIEIVESIELEGPIEIVPVPPESSVVGSLPDAEDSLSFIETLLETASSPQSTPPPPLENDPYLAFLQTLSLVAAESGHALDASAFEGALAADVVALAWSAILRGESEDFSLCTATFDDWASSTLARLCSAPHKVAQLRRELRSRGVAAFGLVEAA